MLRLIGSEPGGAILMALGQRPRRTKQLTAQVRQVSSRSVYRCVAKMEAHGLIERYEEPGVPSTVLLRLTEPRGRNLYRLLRSFDAHPCWETVCLLGDLWEARFVEELSHGPHSLIELVDAPHRLTYHQVRRRATMFVDSGLVEALPYNGNGRHYQLTDYGRRCMALIAGVGRWRHRHVVPHGEPGLEIEEMATVLRAALPLVQLPDHVRTRIDLMVTGPEDKYGHRDTVTLHGHVDPEGALLIAEEAEGDPDGSAAATLNTWFAALVDGNRGRIRVRGDLPLVDACLTRLYDRLWEPAQR